MRSAGTARSIVALALLLPIVLAFAACARSSSRATSAAKRDESASVDVNGKARTYLVHLPVGYDGTRALSLVLALHGGGGAGSDMSGLTHFDSVADQNDFIVVYPDGYQQHWADGRGSSPADRDGVDDLAFINALLDKLEAALNVDTARIYAAGMSNGGFFAARLGCELSSRIAAIGVVAATESTGEVPHCQLTHPVSLALVHGTADPIVPASGGTLTIGEPGTVLSVEGAVATWVQLDGCAATPEITDMPQVANDGTSIQRQMYGGCAQGASVVAYIVTNGGHAWPGGLQYLPVAVVGKTTKNMDASVTLWQYFQAHPMPA